MIRKIFRTGNSVCITLHKRMLRDLGMDNTIYVSVEADKKNKRIIIKKTKVGEY